MNSSNTAPPPTLWDLILAAMSVLTIALLTIMMVAPLDDASKQIIQWADLTICGFFFVDFIRRLVTAPNALRYLKWGWIDLIACIPMVDQLRWARLFRVFQLIRILRGAKASAHLIRTLGAFPRSTSLTIGITTLGLSMLVGAIAILEAEHKYGNINNAVDATWWAFVTVTTVGYGDFYPVTPVGRVVATFLMLIGIGLFGLLAGIFASYLTGNSQEENEELKSLKVEVRELKTLVSKLVISSPKANH